MFIHQRLSELFYAYASDPESSFVPLDQFATGMLVLAHGSKSDKLACAFQLFDKDDTGVVPRARFELFLQSFLTMLSFLNSAMLVAPVNAVKALITRTGKSLADAVIADSSRKDGNISFDEFCYVVFERRIRSTFMG